MKVFALGGEQIRFQKMTGRYWMVQIYRMVPSLFELP